ncbi:MAG: hypothetical protein H0V98_06865 [Chloroflexia bacterium]|nr:hypothetical protein [Chloroflexia bacterium]
MMTTVSSPLSAGDVWAVMSGDENEASIAIITPSNSRIRPNEPARDAEVEGNVEVEE